MKKKRICFMFGHLVPSNGVSRSVVAIANLLASTDENIEIVLYPLYKVDKYMLQIIDSRIKVRKCFGFYFRGFDKLVNLIPKKILYNIFVKSDYEIEIGFQFGNSTKIISASSNHNSTKLCWMHGYDEGLVLKKYYEKLDKVICVSRCNAERLYSEMNGKLNVDYAYNPINDELIRTLGSEEIQINTTARPLFITVARHSPEKGYKRLIDILKRLKDLNYAFEVWFIGDGPIHDELVDYTSILGLGDYVKFLGEQKNPHKYTAKADLYLCSSYVEGYSTTCTEAIMLGVPVLSTNVSGAEEIVSDAKAGMVSDMDDDSLFEALKFVLDNPKILETWKSILKETKYNFSVHARAKRLYQILNIN